MKNDLAPRRQLAQQMRVSITRQQRYLEKHQASRPDTRRTAKPRQDVLPGQGFHLKQQHRACESRNRIRPHATILTPLHLKSQSEVTSGRRWNRDALGALSLSSFGGEGWGEEAFSRCGSWRGGALIC